MLGCIELGGGLDLAIEALDGVLVLHRRGRQHLDGHQPLHPPMLGLEHHAHAAGAELVEHDVLAEHQVLMLARVDDRGLVLGELALADEQLGQCLAIGGPLLGRQAVANRRDLGRRHQAGLAEVIDELLHRERHAAGPEVPP